MKKPMLIMESNHTLLYKINLKMCLLYKVQKTGCGFLITSLILNEKKTEVQTTRYIVK